MTNFLQILGITAILILPMAGSVQAQNALNPIFSSYITGNAQYKTLLSNNYNRIFKQSIPNCTSLPTLSRLKPTVIEDIKFTTPSKNQMVDLANTSFNPSYGQWIERAQLSACDKTIQENLLVTAFDPLSSPQILPLLNGQSRIPPLDQTRAEITVTNALKTLGCYDNSFTLAAKFMGYKSANGTGVTQDNQNSGWFEEWIVDACKTYHTVNLAILPDAQTRIAFIAQIKPQSE